MKAPLAIASAACGFALCAGTAVAAPPLRIVSVSKPGSTVRSYALTLPRARALDAAEVTLTQNGHPVRDLTVSAIGASGRTGDYLLRYRSFVNPSTRVRVAVSVRGITGVATSAYVSPALQLTSPSLSYTPPPPPKPTFSRSRWALLLVVGLIAVLVFTVVRLLIGPSRHPVLERISSFVALAEIASGSGDRAPNPNGLLDRAQASIEAQSWSARLGETLELADISMPVGRFVLGVGTADVLAALVGNAIFGTVGVVVGMGLVPFLARSYVRRALKRKRKAFADQLPDSLDVLASALRAGNSLVGGLSVVADNAAEPSRTEFRRVLAEEQFGVQIENALMVTATRMGNRDVEQLSLVARLQREMGANTAEVLDRVVDTVRGRMELRRLVSSLTAQGRLSRWILTLMPVGIAVLIYAIDPTYMSPLFNSAVGEMLLGLAVVMVASGSFIIGKIVDIKA